MRTSLPLPITPPVCSIVPGRDQAILYGGFSEIKPDSGGSSSAKGGGGGKPLSAAVQAAALAVRAT